MNLQGPQLLYVISVLPALFGLALLGEGVNKITHNELIVGVACTLFGFLLIGIVIFLLFPGRAL